MCVFSNFKFLSEISSSATRLISEQLTGTKFRKIIPFSGNTLDQLSFLGKVGGIFFAAASLAVTYLAVRKAISSYSFRVIENQNQLNTILQKLKEDLAKDLPADEIVIYSRYPQLPILLDQMPKTAKNEFDKIVGVALINKRISNPSYFRNSNYERGVLISLGFSLKNYNNRDEVYGKIKKRLFSLIEQVQTSPVPLITVKRKIEEIAIKERLLAAGIKDWQLDPISFLIRQCKKTESSFEEIVTLPSETLFPNIRLEKARKYLLKRVISRNKNVIRSYLKSLLKQISFFMNSYEDDKYEINRSWCFSDKTAQSLKEKCFDLSFLDKKIKWFENYQELFIHEFKQGDYGLAEINGDGICLGLCGRLALNTILFPNESIEKLKITSILSRDRFHQAFNQLSIWHLSTTLKKKLDSLNKENEDNFMSLENLLCSLHPRNMNKKVKEVTFYRLEDPKDRGFISDLEEGRFSQSAGGVILGRDSHAIFLCVDQKQHRYFFFDPNFGTLQFKQKAQESLTELIERMLTCYAELYDAFYDPKDPMVVTSLIIK